MTKIFVWGAALLASIHVDAFSSDGRLQFLAIFAAAVVILISVASPLWKKGWFWGLILSFAICHLLIAASFDWAWLSDASGKAFGGILALEIGLMFGLTTAICGRLYGIPLREIEKCIDDEPSYRHRDLEL